jgi:hypothetical protein
LPARYFRAGRAAILRRIAAKGTPRVRHFVRAVLCPYHIPDFVNFVIACVNAPRSIGPRDAVKCRVSSLRAERSNPARQTETGLLRRRKSAAVDLRIDDAGLW